jgi:pre-mRNA cleavage complex 2 protein Pcf11
MQVQTTNGAVAGPTANAAGAASTSATVTTAQPQAQSRGPGFPTEAKEFEKFLGSKLARLTFNSRDWIAAITHLARDAQKYHAPLIVSMIVDVLRSSPHDNRLHYMYLMDSILKNVRGAYSMEFGRYIAPLFIETVQRNSHNAKQLSSLKHLLKTWEDTQIFSEGVMQEIHAAVGRGEYKKRPSAQAPVPSRKRTAQAAPRGVAQKRYRQEPSDHASMHDHRGPRDPQRQFAGAPAAHVHSSRRHAPPLATAPHGHRHFQPAHHMPPAQVYGHPPQNTPFGPPPGRPGAHHRNNSNVPYYGQHGKGQTQQHQRYPDQYSNHQPGHHDDLMAALNDTDLSALIGGGKTSQNLPPLDNTTGVLDYKMFENLHLCNENDARTRTAIAMMYDRIPLQCKTCGLRLHDGKKQAKHLDWHFKHNQRLLLRAKSVVSQDWFLPSNDWAEYDGANTVVMPAAPEPELEKSAEKKPVNVPQVEKPAGVDSIVCQICGERFEEEYDDDNAAWMLQNAILEDDMYVHASCLHDDHGGPPPLENGDDE